jgi:flagellar motility protein MotE (MotC chaperone)
MKVSRNPEFWTLIGGLILTFGGSVYSYSKVETQVDHNKSEIDELHQHLADAQKDTKDELKEQSKEINEVKNKVTSISAKMDFLIDIVQENSKRTDSNMRDNQ